MLEHALPNISNMEGAFRRVGDETMAAASQQIEPLRLFSGEPMPRLYDAVIVAMSVRHYCRHERLQRTR